MIQSASRYLPAVAPVFASMMLVAGVARAAPSPGVASGASAGWEESGEASWYGGRHNGRRTSSGTIFNDQEMTAAHATLPLGSKIRVTMQETGQSVVVTITDRQPYKLIRVIDLSRGAASRIGLLNRGTAMVTLARAAATETIEVAEAVGAEAESVGVDDGAVFSGASPRRRGRLHTRHAGRAVAGARPCCRAPSVIQVRRSVRPPAAPRKL